MAMLFFGLVTCPECGQGPFPVDSDRNSSRLKMHMATKHNKRRTLATTPAGVIDGYHEDLVEEEVAAMDSGGAGSAYYTFEEAEGVRGVAASCDLEEDDDDTRTRRNGDVEMMSGSGGSSDTDSIGKSSSSRSTRSDESESFIDFDSSSTGKF